MSFSTVLVHLYEEWQEPGVSLPVLCGNHQNTMGRKSKSVFINTLNKLTC